MTDFASIREFSWSQLGASIDMLQDVLEAAPDDLWSEEVDPQSFWHIAFHTIFWLDFYSSPSREGFAPPEPFGIEELSYGSVLPRAYSRAELLGYLDRARSNARANVLQLTPETALEPADTRRGMARLELVMYTMRHTQHHAGQLIRMLRLHADTGTKWVGRVRAAIQ